MKTISFLLCLLSAHTLLQGQMNYWVLPPNKVTVNVASPTSANLTNPAISANQYVAANGTYDENGNLLFYIIDREVYDAASNWVGQLNYHDNGTTNYAFIGKEIAIVPIPGTCKQFYAIYTLSAVFLGTAVVATKINCDSGSPVVDNGGVAAGNCSNPYGFNCSLVDFLNGNWSAIAVSKCVNVNNVNTRYLFAVGYNGLRRYAITNSGIGAGLVLADATTHPSIFYGGTLSQTIELELSQDGTRLAWGRYGQKEVCVAALNSTYSLSSLNIYNGLPNGGINSIEFDPTNINKIFVASTSGIYNYDYQNSIYTTITTNAAYQSTQIERAKNGKMYIVNSTTDKLCYFTPGNASIAGTNIIMYGDGVSGPIIPGYHSLPEQIDGDNYDWFLGTGNAVASFKINGSAVSSTTASFTPFYHCYNMLLTDFVNAANTLYRYEIYTYPGNLLATSSCTTWLTAAQVQTNLKLFCNSYLSTATGKHKIRLYAKNDCKEVFTDRYIEMFGNPGGVGSVAATVNNGIGGTANSKNLAAPTLTGNQGGTFNVGGNINQISMDKVCVKIEELMPNGEEPGVPGFVTIYDVCTDYVNGVTQLNAVSLNGLQCNPVTGACIIGQNYFVPKDGIKFRITATVSNECSTSSDWGYFKPDPIYYRAGNIADETSFLVSPNPFTDMIGIEILAPNGVETVTFRVFDMSGRNVGNERFSAKNSGQNTFEWNGSYLSTGLYTYILQVGNEQYRGKIVKVNP